MQIVINSKWDYDSSRAPDTTMWLIHDASTWFSNLLPLISQVLVSRTFPRALLCTMHHLCFLRTGAYSSCVLKHFQSWVEKKAQTLPSLRFPIPALWAVTADKALEGAETLHWGLLQEPRLQLHLGARRTARQGSHNTDWVLILEIWKVRSFFLIGTLTLPNTGD